MSITITGANLAELVAQVAELTGGTAAAAPAETTKTSGRGKGKAAEEGKEEKAEKDDGPTVDQIRELASKIETDADQDKAIELISDAGSESISGLEKKSAAVRQKVFDGITAILNKKSRKALD